MPLIIYTFREIRCSKSPTLLKGTNETFSLIFYSSRSKRIKIGKGDIHKIIE